MAQTITEDGEIVTSGEITRYDGGMTAQIAKAEIESLVATARAYPRQISKAMERMKSLATMDEESAAECVYALPRGKKTIEGPSIRFAEMASQCWGNSRSISRTTAVDRVEKYVETEGAFLDCETNVATSKRVRRPIQDSSGRLYKDDMIVMTANAGSSIALRNAILAGIPKAAWRPAYDAARSVVMGTVTTLANNRAKAIGELQRFGLTAEQVFLILGVSGVDDIDREKLVPLRSMFVSLRSQEITVEELLKGAGASPQLKSQPVNPLKDDEPAQKKEPQETVAEDKAAAPVESTAAAPSEPDPEKIAEPSDRSESEQMAYERGAKDKRDGLPRVAPKEWRTKETEHLALVYLQGHLETRVA